MKTTSNGRRPKNVKSWISQQSSLIESFSNFKLKLRGLNQKLKCLKWRQQPKEDDLKILKVKYISSHWLNLSQILKLSSGDQNKINMLEMKTTSNGRRPQILSIEYLSTYLSDLPQILNLSSGNQTKNKKRLEMKTTSIGRWPRNKIIHPNKFLILLKF